ncbi:unnamed protein product [Nezara viridula]|uniref:Probable RNA-binding protein EIF1AD n=1 Tax=Nezara viridula TaxID=85310 RepID=A0A9P0EDW9_NEZVI|nr:unnamed protein product [Nezara viridula]
MSKTTKKKHVMSDMLFSGDLLLEEGQKIVRVVCGRGNNLHEVEELEPSGDNFLVSMPVRFRKTVWVKRGDYLIVQPIEEGDKVKAEITDILTRDRIKYLKQRKLWPGKEDDHSDSSCNEDIPENTNRISVACDDSDSSDSDD